MPENLGQAVLELRTDDSRLSQGISSARDKAEQLAMDFGKFGLGMSTLFTLPLGAVAALGVGFNAMKEQATVAFTTMLGSAETATTFLKDLEQFAKTTPFEFPGLVRLSQQLLAMGFAAQDVKPMLTSLGDAASGLGVGPEIMERMVMQLGQMQAKGKVASEEMRVLAQTGIPVWDLLAKKLGTDVAGAMDQVQKGAVSAGVGIEALVNGMNERFGGMMELQSRTFSGVLSTISDTAGAMAGNVLLPLFEKLRDGLLKVADVLPAIEKFLVELDPSVKNFALGFGAVLALAGPVALGIAGIGAAIALLMTPLGLATLAIGAFVGAMLAFPKMREVVADVLKNVIGLFTLLISQVKSIALAVNQVLLGQWKNAFETMKTSGTRSMDAMVESLDKFDSVARFAGGTVKDVEAQLKKTTATAFELANGTAAIGAAAEETSKKAKAAQEKITEVIAASMVRLRDSMDESMNAVVENVTKSYDTINQIVARNALAMGKHSEDAATTASKWLDVQTDAWEKSLDDRVKAADQNLKSINDAELRAFNNYRNLLAERAKEEQRRLAEAVTSVKNSAGEIFDAMFLKGESVFSSLQNALKGGALSLGRSIFEDITGQLLGPIKKAFDDFFRGLLEGSGLRDLISGLGAKLSGALSGLLGGGGGAAGTVAGVAGGGSGAAGAIGSAISGAGGLISGGLAAAGGIIGGLLGEGNARRTEEHTRETRDWLQLMATAWNPLFHDIRNAVVASRSADSFGRQPSTSAPVVNVTVNGVVGDSRAVALAVGSEIQRLIQSGALHWPATHNLQGQVI